MLDEGAIEDSLNGFTQILENALKQKLTVQEYNEARNKEMQNMSAKDRAMVQHLQNTLQR